MLKKQKKQQFSLKENDQLINLVTSADSQNRNLDSEIQAGRGRVKERLISLDIFRGLTMAGMILVDDGSDINNNQKNIWPIKHSEWNGWTTADQIFPNFLFIMGMAIPFAIQFSDRIKFQTWKKLIIRSFLLVFIGLIITFQQQIPEIFETKPFYLHFRLPGILQRLGICYFVVASLYLAFESLQIQALIYFCSTIIYIGLQYGLNVPDYTKNGQTQQCGRGMVDSEECNAGAYIDRSVFGNGRFAWVPYDPEGLLGFLNSFTNTFLGMHFTLIMKQLKSDKTKLLITWLILALILTSSGLFINLWMPLNKKQWSVSFMLFTSGFSGITLLFCFYVLDMLNSPTIKKLASPLQWLGMNPLFIYIMVMIETGLLQNNLPKVGDGQRNIFDWFAYQAFYTIFKNDYIANACNSVLYLIFWTLLAYILFRKNIFIKL